MSTVTGGDIEIRGTRGDFEVRNVNGGIEMVDVAGSGRVGTVNGPLHVTFTEHPRSACSFGTINGDIGNVAHIRGWYCPSTGRIHFVHRNLDSGDAVRVFTGNVSDAVAGQPLFMGGTMTVLISAFGDLGEYNFAGTKD